MVQNCCPCTFRNSMLLQNKKNCRRTVLFGKPHSRTEMITTVAERTILTVLMEILLRNGNTVAERKCCCRSEFKTGNVLNSFLFCDRHCKGNGRLGERPASLFSDNRTAKKTVAEQKFLFCNKKKNRSTVVFLFLHSFP